MPDRGEDGVGQQVGAPAERCAGPDAPEATLRRLGRFRNYLRLLAEKGIGQRFGSKFDPSDIVQETLLKACRSVTKFTGQRDGEIAAWLRAILARSIVNAARHHTCGKRDLRREQPLQEALARTSAMLGDLAVGDAASPCSKCICEETLLQIADALAALPADQREALLLKHWRGWSIARIAAHMGRTNAAVAGLLRRGLRGVREKVDSSR